MTCENCIHFDICNEQADGNILELMKEPCFRFMELVRCRDCKHWLKDVAGCTDAIGRCKWANYMVGAVGYCVYGERKENETD